MKRMAILILLILATSAVGPGGNARAADPTPDTIYLDFTGIDARKDLDADTKTALKKKIAEEMLANLNQGGKKRVEITDDPKKAKRTVTFKNEWGEYESATGKQHAWGWWKHGSSTTEVFVKEWLDDPKVADSFKKDNKFDAEKLGRGMGTISSHETAHSYSAGHKDPPQDKNKMNPVFDKDLATTPYVLDADSLAVIDKNLGKEPCKPKEDKKKPALVAHYESDSYSIPAGEPSAKFSDPYSVDLHLGYQWLKPSLTGSFDFGWLGADGDLGSIDGNSEFDFIFKQALEGLNGSSLITMFDGWTANFTLSGIGGGYAGQWFIAGLDEIFLSDFITNWRGVDVARHLDLRWDIDGVPGVDLVVSLDARAYGNTDTTNGLRPVPEPGTLVLLASGAIGIALVRRGGVARV